MILLTESEIKNICRRLFEHQTAGFGQLNFSPVRRFRAKLPQNILHAPD